MQAPPNCSSASATATSLFTPAHDVFLLRGNTSVHTSSIATRRLYLTQPEPSSLFANAAALVTLVAVTGVVLRCG